MSRFLMTLASASVLCAAPCIAQPGELIASQISDFTAVMLEEAVAQLEGTALSGGARPQDFEHVSYLVGLAFTDDPEEADGRAQVLRERLNRAIADIESKVREGWVEAVDFHDFLEQILDARLERALDQLQRQAIVRGATREMFERVERLMQERAEAAGGEDPESTVFLERSLRAIREAVGSAQTAYFEPTGFEPTSFESVRLDVLRARLNRTITWLQRNARARGVTREDYQRVYDAYVDLALAESQP